MSRLRSGEVRYLLAGAYYRMAYVAYGRASLPTVVCVHGLTRTGRDFDMLAEALSGEFHVVCPDLPGRGDSDWLPDTSLYHPYSYVQAISHLLAVIGRPIGFLGTSLGGIVGLAIASSIGQPISRLILNDVGPQIPADAQRRIRDYIVRQPVFPDMTALEWHIRQVHAPFGDLTDAQWEHLAKHSARPLEDGRVVLHYDPGIAKPLRTAFVADTDLWPWWEKLHIPVLAIRGENSDLLLPRTLARMERDGASSLIVPNAGHAPALMDAESIDVIRQFLQAGI